MNTPDPASYELLHHQVQRLESLERDVAGCRSALPSLAGVWRGHAHSAFVASLHTLDTELSAGHHQLALAIARTKSSITGVQAHA